MTKSDSHSWNISILVTILARYLCQIFIMDTVLICGSRVSWCLMPDVRQQWHRHPAGNVLAEVLREVVRKPHDGLVAVSIPVLLLVQAAKLLGEIKELLPTIAVRILISAHGTTVVSVLVQLIKLWGLEQHHNQLEALQLFSGEFSTLLHVAILPDDGIQLL